MNAPGLRPLPPAHPDADLEPRRIIIQMVAAMAGFLLFALIWANLAMLDVSVSAPGSVTPTNRLHEVSSLDGGVVEELRVAPGQRVQRGDVLLRLDTAQAGASLGENRQLRLAALAGRARTDALLNGTTPRFDPAWRQEAPALIEKEFQLWRDAWHEYQSTLAVGREGVSRRQSELDEAKSRMEQTRRSLQVAEEAFAIEDKLFREGAGSRADWLGAKQRLIAQQTELDSLHKSLPRLEAGLAEAQASLREADARARAQWGAQRSEFETKAATLNSTLAGHENKLARREVVAPVSGIINRVLIPASGGVAMPGKTLIEIVPDESESVMTVRVKPADIGFIHPGQTARVQVLPYDASTYGRLQATVSRVGADAVVNEKGEAFFEVQLMTSGPSLQLHGKPLPITPGMPVEAGILTGQRSVMQYLLKPVLRGVQSALQER